MNSGKSIVTLMYVWLHIKMEIHVKLIRRIYIYIYIYNIRTVQIKNNKYEISHVINDT